MSNSVSDILLATGATGAASSTKSASGNSALGKDAFLQILVAQLQNQDPTQPMQDKDFIAQMAQFSSLEQMQQLNTNYAYSQAYSLLGKTISASFNDSNKQTNTVTGMVSGVTTYNSSPYLIVNGSLVPMTASMAVVANDTSGDSVVQSALLLGRTITAKLTADDGTTSTVTGVVSRVGLSNGKVVAYVGDKAISLNSITDVAETAASAT
jgi:flagellar basal-body rod modification protein FlgD